MKRTRMRYAESVLQYPVIATGNVFGMNLLGWICFAVLPNKAAGLTLVLISCVLGSGTNCSLRMRRRFGDEIYLSADSVEINGVVFKFEDGKVVKHLYPWRPLPGGQVYRWNSSVWKGGWRFDEVDLRYLVPVEAEVG